MVRKNGVCKVAVAVLFAAVVDVNVSAFSLLPSGSNKKLSFCPRSMPLTQLEAHRKTFRPDPIAIRQRMRAKDAIVEPAMTNAEAPRKATVLTTSRSSRPTDVRERMRLGRANLQTGNRGDVANATVSPTVEKILTPNDIRERMRKGKARFQAEKKGAVVDVAPVVAQKVVKKKVQVEPTEAAPETEIEATVEIPQSAVEEQLIDVAAEAQAEVQKKEKAEKQAPKESNKEDTAKSPSMFDGILKQFSHFMKVD